MTRILRIALPAVLAHLCGILISQTLPATLAHEASVISSWSYAICRPTTGKWSDRLQVAAFLPNTHCLHRAMLRSSCSMSCSVGTKLWRANLGGGCACHFGRYSFTSLLSRSIARLFGADRMP